MQHSFVSGMHCELDYCKNGKMQRPNNYRKAYYCHSFKKWHVRTAANFKDA